MNLERVLSTELLSMPKDNFPKKIVQNWIGGIEVSRMLALTSFNQAFMYVSKEHLELILSKLEAGEIDGENFTLDTQDIDKNPYGDLMAVIGQDLVKNGTDLEKANISFFNFCNRYGHVDYDAPFIVWMRAIKPGDTPSSSEVARFFSEAIKSLMEKKSEQ